MKVEPTNEKNGHNGEKDNYLTRNISIRFGDIFRFNTSGTDLGSDFTNRLHEAVPHFDNGIDAPHHHRSNPKISNLGVPQSPGSRIRRFKARPLSEKWNSDKPANGAPDKNQQSNVEPNNHSHRQKRRRNITTKEENPFACQRSVFERTLNQSCKTPKKFERRTNQGSENNPHGVARTLFRSLTGFEN